jgi:hypothetical protein
VNLEFNSLNSLLHTVLTYLRGHAPMIPGGADVPRGTPMELSLNYPEADEPIRVAGVSRGLDPAGRGLRLTLEDPKALDQVTLILAHLHLGPYVARSLFDYAEAKARPAGTISQPPVEEKPPDGEITVGMSRSRRQGLDALAREKSRDLSARIADRPGPSEPKGQEHAISPFRNVALGSVELLEEPTLDPAVDPVTLRASATQLPRLAFVAEMEKSRTRERVQVPGTKADDSRNVTQIVSAWDLPDLPDDEDY